MEFTAIAALDLILRLSEKPIGTVIVHNFLMYPTIYVIRHGFTDANRDEIVAGGGFESHILPEGLNQAREAGVFLRTLGIKKIFCSPMIRTRQTLEALQLPGIPVEFDARLREIDCGIHEGKPFNEMGERFALSNLARTPDLQHPKGESARMLCKRLRSFIDEKLTPNPSPVLLIMHGGSGTAFALELLKSAEILKECPHTRGLFGNSEVIKLENGHYERVFSPTLKSQ
jgi:probable phosphoglycerate mutase